MPLPDPVITPQKTGIDQQFLARAKEFLSIPSMAERPQDVKRALQYVVDMLQKYPNITVEHFEQNDKASILAYYGDTRPKRFATLLNGHVDVVPANMSQFSPKVVGERLYARGALDMKVMTILMVEAFCAAAPVVDYPLGLQITTDEEIGGYDGILHQIEQGVETDCVIAGERTSLDVTTMMKGICWLKIAADGKHAHGSRPWDGENAVRKLTHLSEKLLAMFPQPTKEDWTTTINVAWIDTDNKTHNRIPDTAEMGLDIRPLPNDPRFASKESVRTLIANIDPTLQVHFVLFEQGVYAEADNPHVAALIAAMKKAGHQAKPIRRFAGSDIRFYAPNPTTTCVEFGLEGDGDHSDEEYIELRSIPTMQQALHHYLRHLPRQRA